MKALSIRQPWAWSILNAGKRIENRTWYNNYRGPFLIHAAKGLTRQEYEDWKQFYIHEIDWRPESPEVPSFDAFERGGIVGKAVVVDCLAASSQKRIADPWFSGPFGFVLDQVEKVPFVPLMGKLGFFDVPDDILSVPQSGPAEAQQKLAI